MDVVELAPGLWRWTAPHPDWTPEARWPEDVGCLLCETADALVLVDPLVPGAERERFLAELDRDVERAARPVHVLQTVGWHVRSIPELVARYGASTELPASVSAIEIAGIELEPARERVLWLPDVRALVPGDTLLGDALLRVCPPDWVSRQGVYPIELVASLRSLLELPVEMVLVSHGDPVLAGGHAALAAALERSLT